MDLCLLGDPLGGGSWPERCLPTAGLEYKYALPGSAIAYMVYLCLRLVFSEKQQISPVQHHGSPLFTLHACSLVSVSWLPSWGFGICTAGLLASCHFALGARGSQRLWTAFAIPPCCTPPSAKIGTDTSPRERGLCPPTAQPTGNARH